MATDSSEPVVVQATPEQHAAVMEALARAQAGAGDNILPSRGASGTTTRSRSRSKSRQNTNTTEASFATARSSEVFGPSMDFTDRSSVQSPLSPLESTRTSGADANSSFWTPPTLPPRPRPTDESTDSSINFGARRKIRRVMSSTEPSMMSMMSMMSISDEDKELISRLSSPTHPRALSEMEDYKLKNLEHKLDTINDQLQFSTSPDRVDNEMELAMIRSRLTFLREKLRPSGLQDMRSPEDTGLNMSRIISKALDDMEKRHKYHEEMDKKQAEFFTMLEKEKAKLEARLNSTGASSMETSSSGLKSTPAETTTNTDTTTSIGNTPFRPRSSRSGQPSMPNPMKKGKPGFTPAHPSIGHAVRMFKDGEWRPMTTPDTILERSSPLIQFGDDADDDNDDNLYETPIRSSVVRFTERDGDNNNEEAKREH